MQERARMTRERILNAAERLFAKHGFAAAGVDAIAADADVNKQRIYAYFGSKRGLFEAVLAAAFARSGWVSEEMIARAEAAPGRLTEILLDGFKTVHKENPNFWRLLAWANLEPDLDLGALDRVRRDEDRRLRRLFKRERDAGRLTVLSFSTYLLTLMSVVYFTHSNRQTLIHTLGVDVQSSGMGKRMTQELAALFGGGTKR